MTRRVRLITRIALFSALVYLFSWATSFLPNINLAFFIAFAAGYLWGLLPGALVGGLGMGLWTVFNPYGPATLPVTVAQIVGFSLSGLAGGFARPLCTPDAGAGRWLTVMLIAAAAATGGFFLIVSAVDAWVFQPFWPRFITGLVWALPSLGANLLIFTLLFPVLKQIYGREQARV